MASILEYGLLNASFVAVLACLVYVLCLFIKRPEIRHILWVLVLLKLVVPPLFGVPVWLHESLESEPETKVIEEKTPTTELPKPSIHLETLIVPEFGGDAGFGPLPPIDFVPQEKQSPVTLAQSITPINGNIFAPVTPVRPVAWWVYLGYVWVGVSGILLGMLAWRVLRFSRLLRHSKLASPEVFALVNELRKCLGLSHTPYVRVTQEKMWPSLWAPIPFSNYATILIPEQLLNQLNDQEKRAILTHELVHLRRGDPCWRWLEVSASILFWWFPLVSWIRKNLHTAEEACCDLYTVEVLADRRAYASALVETAWFVGNSGTPLLTSGVGPIVNLKRRITMVMQPKTLRKSRWVLAALLAVGVTSLAFGPAIAQGPGSKAKDPLPVKDGEKNPPRGGGGFGGPPGGGDPVKEPSAEEVKKAREEYRKAVEEFLKAREKLTDAENALRKVDRSSVGGFGGFPGGPGVIVPSNPSVPVGPGGGRPPVGPGMGGMGGGFPGMPGGPPMGGFPGMGGPGGGPVGPMGMGGTGGPPRGMGGMGIPGGPGMGLPPMGMGPRDPMNTPRPMGMGGMGGGFQPMGMGPRDPNPELQKQLEDLKRQLDELKRQLENRRGTGGGDGPSTRPAPGGRGGDGRDPAPRPVRPSGGSGDSEELPRNPRP